MNAHNDYFVHTAALYQKAATKTMLICTDVKTNDKYMTGCFHIDLYSNEIPSDDTVNMEVIWSDGPSSEFKVF